MPNVDKSSRFVIVGVTVLSQHTPKISGGILMRQLLRYGGGLCLVAVFLLVGSIPVHAQDAKPTEFMRITKDAKGGEPKAFQTANVKYKCTYDGKTVYVTLSSVVHVASRGYYERHNDDFDNYDCVLYELVAPKGTIPKPKQDGKSPLHMIQKLMSAVLGLEHQMDCVDYTPKHFVHSDMSPQEMQAAMAKRGDDQLSLILRILSDMMRQENLQKKKGGPAPPQFDPMSFLDDPYAASKLKRMMAMQMVEQGSGGVGETLQQLLIDDRNKKCMSVLAEQLKAGKKNVTLFWGAAHMPDFEKRLRSAYGAQKESADWFTAWNLQLQETDLLEVLLRMMRE
ncbi:hypothetical protein COW95_03785 [Candidatus Peregrinibacteria bacterium CG22_combo_CG10-13_8_21_14_all_49_11]|nr:MAG: hypothetical protein COW95_03785 [Candidatus Peregrinibacteria bacterium CG22_combo_CG10-13_8_21_14_all_49_11]